MCEYNEGIVGAGKMFVKHLVGYSNRVVGLKPAYRVVVDFDAGDPGNTDCNTKHGNTGYQLATPHRELATAAQQPGKSGVRVRRLRTRCELGEGGRTHAHDIGRNQQNR